MMGLVSPWGILPCRLSTSHRACTSSPIRIMMMVSPAGSVLTAQAWSILQDAMAP
eukprot:CAMPEP_0115129748 /NCGR_PEP_ID=MMETSP0227-20121206/51990_1 /TAXON_ID=89957 /ORGANISM="Polarella glacialis, Strain CCMP 1383" /LENGTH=54 /DNA_ID=CAMNT_0002534705 /DNA_START=60 /DNA_END=224 /DNA_ORIENTATION=-